MNLVSLPSLRLRIRTKDIIQMATPAKRLTMTMRTMLGPLSSPTPVPLSADILGEPLTGVMLPEGVVVSGGCTITVSPVGTEPGGPLTMTGSLAAVVLALLVRSVVGEVSGVFLGVKVVAGCCLVSVVLWVVGCWSSDSVLVSRGPVVACTVVNLLIVVSGLGSALTPASVKPGVSGCVSKIFRSASIQRIWIAGPTVTTPANVLSRENPQTAPRKSVVSVVQVKPEGTQYATFSPDATAGKPSFVLVLSKAKQVGPTAKPLGQMAGE